MTSTRAKGANVALLESTLEFIEANPGLWDQELWRDVDEPCRGCMAHHLARRGGAEFIMDTWRDPKVPQGGEQPCWCREAGCWDDSECYDYYDVVTPDGRIMTMEGFAREVAGLSAHDASVMFRGSNDLAALRAQVAAIKARAAMADLLESVADAIVEAALCSAPCVPPTGLALSRLALMAGPAQAPPVTGVVWV